MVRLALATFRAVSKTGFEMIFVKYQNGTTQRGVLLTLGGDSIRVAIEGCDDAVEFRKVSGRWISADCEVVTFEFGEQVYDTDDPAGLPAFFARDSCTDIARLIM
jgi:hypothetical protein